MASRLSRGNLKRAPVLQAELPTNKRPRREVVTTGDQSTNAPTSADVLTWWRAELQQASSEADRTGMHKYMRCLFPFFGVKTPARKSLGKIAPVPSNLADFSTLTEHVRLLWREEERELQYVALDLLIKHVKTFVTNAPPSDGFSFLKELIVTKSWWDTVDLIASTLVGGLVKQNPAIGRAVMDAWIDDENVWVKRSAILHSLKYKDQVDQPRLLAYCLRHGGESEDWFLRKAVGWALREHAKTDPEAVRSFVKKHGKELSALSQKEAMKHLK